MTMYTQWDIDALKTMHAKHVKEINEVHAKHIEAVISLYKAELERIKKALNEIKTMMEAS